MKGVALDEIENIAQVPTNERRRLAALIRDGNKHEAKNEFVRLCSKIVNLSDTDPFLLAAELNALAQQS